MKINSQTIPNIIKKCELETVYSVSEEQESLTLSCVAGYCISDVLLSQFLVGISWNEELSMMIIFKIC